jgi:hypothetical protein
MAEHLVAPGIVRRFNAKAAAFEAGLYVIEQSGDTINMPKGFKLRE